MVLKSKYSLASSSVIINAEKAIHWDGRCESGELVSSGTYYIQLQAGEYSETKNWCPEVKLKKEHSALSSESYTCKVYSPLYV